MGHTLFLNEKQQSEVGKGIRGNVTEWQREAKND